MNLKFLTIVFLTLGYLWTLPSVVDAQVGRSENEEARVEIKFSTPTTFSEIEQVVYQYGLSLKEINYEISNPYGETIYGGYTVDEDLTLDSAFADFQQKHEEFFREAVKILTADIKNQKEKSVVLGLRNLRNQLSALFEDYKRDGLKLSSITVNDSPSLNLLSKDIRFARVEYVNNSARQSEKTFDSLSSQPNALAGYPWSPYKGASKVTKSMTFQVFYFNNVSAFGSNSTYEQETQVYNTNFANYDNYYSTNLPSAYKDTQFADSNGVDNFTVGTSKASSLKNNTQYYTNMALRGQTASTATVRIKGQLGHRTPSWCYSTWCIFADATTPSLTSFTAPISNQINW